MDKLQSIEQAAKVLEEAIAQAKEEISLPSTHYFYNKPAENQQAIFSCMVLLATPILEAFHGDLYHNAIRLSKMNMEANQIFYYLVGIYGTDIVDSLFDAKVRQQHDREHMFKFYYRVNEDISLEKNAFMLTITKED